MIKCLQRRLAWCNHRGMKFDPGNEQYSVFPRALSDENGVPHKAPKRHWTDKLQDRYKNMQHKVFTNDFLNAWLLPHYSVILDAMFLINTKPLRSTKTVTDYLQLIDLSRNTSALEHVTYTSFLIHHLQMEPLTQKWLSN